LNNYSSELLNVPNVSYGRQIEVRATEVLIPGASGLEVKIVIAKLKKVSNSRQ
jgi:hypothetical protein